MVSLTAISRGLGQVMLQRNAAAGALFAFGIALNSLTMAAAALLGSSVGTVLARLGKFPPSEIEDGLYGFNGALVAIAAMLFYAPSVVGVLAGTIGVLLSTIVMRIMHKYSLAPFTFPFIVVTWAALFLLPPAGGAASRTFVTGVMPVDGFCQALGQVMFQANSLTGLVFLVALLVSSKRSALFAVAGAVAGVIAGIAAGWPADQVAAGIYGYNAVLTGIAASLVGGTALPVIGTLLLSIAITKAMLVTGLPALTFPFVLSMWVMSAWRRWNRGGAIHGES